MEVSEKGGNADKRGEALTIQGCCAMSEAGICDPGACLQKCFGGSNLHNAAAGPPGSPLSVSLCFTRERKRMTHMEVNNRPVDTSSPPNPWRLTWLLCNLIISL